MYSKKHAQGFPTTFLLIFALAILVCPSNPVSASDDAVSFLMEEDEPNYLSDLEAHVYTSKGKFVMTFLPDIAPMHVLNFIALAEADFFDGLTFHRYVEDFVVQGGDPLGTGTGGPGFNIPAEIYDAPLHVKGAVGMARTSDEVNPDRMSSGSQFYICLEDVHRLDGKYTVWANVTDGMDVVMELRAGDIIENVRIRKSRDDFETGIEALKEELASMDMETELQYNELMAVVQTNKGTIKMGFFHDTAPQHVENFIKLVREGFYDGLTFHRYVSGFVIQGGDPDGTGQGGPGYTIPAEISPKHNHVKGAVAMARLGDAQNPEKRSSGSQYYICLEPASHLNGGYTVWGEVIEGMEVVMELREGDIMEKIEILPIPESKGQDE